MGLACVFDDLHTVRAGEVDEPLDVAKTPVEMDRHERFRPWREGGRDRVDGHAVVLIHVDEDRRRAGA